MSTHTSAAITQVLPQSIVPSGAQTRAGWAVVVTGTISTGDVLKVEALMADGSTVDLGDYIAASANRRYVRGEITSITGTVTQAKAGSTTSCYIVATEVDDIPATHGLERYFYLYSGNVPCTITFPGACHSASNMWSFSLAGTWTAGTITPTEYEPGGYSTSYGAVSANYASRLRSGPVSTMGLVRSSTFASVPGVLFSSYHQAPIA